MLISELDKWIKNLVFSDSFQLQYAWNPISEKITLFKGDYCTEIT